jgi:hypothetical protein
LAPKKTMLPRPMADPDAARMNPSFEPQAPRPKDLLQEREAALENDSWRGGPREPEERSLRNLQHPFEHRTTRAPVGSHAQPLTSPKRPGSSQRVSSPSTTSTDSNFAPRRPEARWGSMAKIPRGGSASTSFTKG